MFGLSWIGFVFKACLGPSNGPVEHEDLLGVVLARTKTPALPQLVFALKLRLEPIELSLGTDCSEVVTMDARGEAASLVHKHAWRCISLFKACRLQES